ncbi:hypothetical protein H4582DRAFT_2053658 [Lactarius indigo]|nr:hypothetical protein H4582DRAFT_2053658 [Lactarius indigo]
MCYNLINVREAWWQWRGLDGAWWALAWCAGGVAPVVVGALGWRAGSAVAGLDGAWRALAWCVGVVAPVVVGALGWRAGSAVAGLDGTWWVLAWRVGVVAPVVVGALGWRAGSVVARSCTPHWRGVKASGDGSGVLRAIRGRRGVKLEEAGSWAPGRGGVVAGCGGGPFATLAASPRHLPPASWIQPLYPFTPPLSPSGQCGLHSHGQHKMQPTDLPPHYARMTPTPRLRRAPAMQATTTLPQPQHPATIPRHTHHKEVADDELGFGPADKISHAVHPPPCLASPPNRLATCKTGQRCHAVPSNRGRPSTHIRLAQVPRRSKNPVSDLDGSVGTHCPKWSANLRGGQIQPRHPLVDKDTSSLLSDRSTERQKMADKKGKGG